MQKNLLSLQVQIFYFLKVSPPNYNGNFAQTGECGCRFVLHERKPQSTLETGKQNHNRQQKTL